MNLFSKLKYFVYDFWFYLILIFVSTLFLVFLVYRFYKSNIKGRSKKILISACFSLYFLFAIFAIFEGYFRYVYDESDGLGFLKVNEKWHERHVIYNTNFFRDRDFSPKKSPEVTRIGVLGDSVTFGGGIEDVGNRFSNLLEKKLNEDGLEVEVYNLGRPGTDTEAQIKLYAEIEYLDFDIVVWQYFLNDIQPQERSTGKEVILKSRQRNTLIQKFSNVSYFFDFVYWRLSGRYEKTFEDLKTADLDQYRNMEMLESHKKIIGSLIGQLEASNKKVIVVIFPFVHYLGPDYPANDIHSAMRAVFESAGAETIDLLEDFKNLDRNLLIASRFDSHPNEKAHEIASIRLYEKLIEYFK